MRLPPYLLGAAWLGAIAGCVVDAPDDLAEVSAQAAVTPGDYRLVRRGSEKCLDVAGGGSSNGTKLQQWSCVDTSNQAFRIESAGDDVYRLVHPASGKCAAVAGGGSSNGTQIQLATCGSSGAQKFRFEPSGAGASRLRNPSSNKCLDVNASSSADGAKVQIWSCNGTDAQRWQLVSLDGSDDDGGDDGGATTKWADAVVTAYTFQDNSACNSVMTSSGRPLVPYVSVALPFRYIQGLGSGPFQLGDTIYVSFLAGRLMPNGVAHSGWVRIDDFCGDHGDDAYCFQNGKPNVDLYVGDWARSGMTCHAANLQQWGTGSFAGPGGDGQEDTEVFFGPAPAGGLAPGYGGRAMGDGACGDCDFGRTVQPPACWHYDPGDTNVEYCDCSNSNC